VGNIVGMAYVVARGAGRYEIRESVHSPSGPRSRTLANFAVLTDDVMAKAQGRATRPFDSSAVINSALRRGVRLGEEGFRATARPLRAQGGVSDYAAFVRTSRRLGASFERPPAERPDPGRALIELAGLVDALPADRRLRPPELEFPVLARLAGTGA